MDHASGLVFHRPQAASHRRSVVYFCSAVLTQNGQAGVFQVPATGGVPEPLSILAEGELDHLEPSILPGGDLVMFTVPLSEPFDDWPTVVQSVSTGERTTVLTGGQRVRYVPTGHLVYYAGAGTLLARQFDLDRLEVTSPAVPVVEGVSQSMMIEPRFTVSAAGSLVYQPGDVTEPFGGTLFWTDREGREETVGLDFDPPVQLSPDATRVVFVKVDAASGTDLWISNLEDGTSRRLTFDPGFDTSPIWTPNGRAVVFSSSRTGKGLWQKAADGTGEANRLTESPDSQWPLTFSPDGTALVLMEQHGIETGWELAILREGETTVRPLGQNAFTPVSDGWGTNYVAISPNGHWIAYTSNETGQFEINVSSFPDMNGRWQVSSGGGLAPIWGPDGRDGLIAVEVETEATFTRGPLTIVLDTVRPVQDTGFGSFSREATETIPVGVSPDAQRFLMWNPSTPNEGSTRTEIVVVLNWFEELKRLVPTN